MAIQFPCGACGQPVEIDDEWGGKTVACPFCHAQIIAPTESRLENEEEVPMAAAMQSSPPPFVPVPEVAYVPSVTPVGSNRLAIVAAVLAGVMMSSLIIHNRLMAPYFDDIRAMTERISELIGQGKGLMVAVQTAQLEFLEKIGDGVTGLVVASMFQLFGGCVWLAAIICAIIAVRRPQHKRYAVAALVACGITPILFCCMGGGM